LILILLHLYFNLKLFLFCFTFDLPNRKEKNALKMQWQTLATIHMTTIFPLYFAIYARNCYVFFIGFMV